MLEQHTQKIYQRMNLHTFYLIGGSHNKQGSKDALVRIAVLLTLSLIKITYVFWCSIVNWLVCQKKNFKNNSVMNS